MHTNAKAFLGHWAMLATLKHSRENILQQHKVASPAIGMIHFYSKIQAYSSLAGKWASWLELWNLQESRLNRIIAIEIRRAVCKYTTYVRGGGLCRPMEKKKKRRRKVIRGFAQIHFLAAVSRPTLAKPRAEDEHCVGLPTGSYASIGLVESSEAASLKKWRKIVINFWKS